MDVCIPALSVVSADRLHPPRISALALGRHKLAYSPKSLGASTAESLRVSHTYGKFSDIAIFSDGLERLSLDFARQVAFKPFFDSMLKPLSGLPPGRDRNSFNWLAEIS
jgi:hypothetical protein